MLKSIIHSGHNQIGASCVEIYTDTTRIIVDIGLPIETNANSANPKFIFNHQFDLLPNVKGLYSPDKENMVHAVILSHSHLDHYGLYNHVDRAIPCYLGRATNSIIEINNLFLGIQCSIERPNYYEDAKPFTIGDITITAYLVDHSAFDAYSFLFESGETKIFYSGDFRANGRKHQLYDRMKSIVPQNLDELILEGTNLNKGITSKSYYNEYDIENILIDLLEQSTGFNFIYASAQNIDRIVSIYKACIKTNRTLLIDFYTAYVLDKIGKYAKIPCINNRYSNLKVVYFGSGHIFKKLEKAGKSQDFYKFKNDKIKIDDLLAEPTKYVLLVRQSMLGFLKKYQDIENGNYIHSAWSGYLDSGLESISGYLMNQRNFKLNTLHCSGHADASVLKDFVNSIKPQKITPIHTNAPEEYKTFFD